MAESEDVPLRGQAEGKEDHGGVRREEKSGGGRGQQVPVRVDGRAYLQEHEGRRPGQPPTHLRIGSDDELLEGQHPHQHGHDGGDLVAHQCADRDADDAEHRQHDESRPPSSSRMSPRSSPRRAGSRSTRH